MKSHEDKPLSAAGKQTFLDQIFERRDRERSAGGVLKVSADDALCETNRQGTMRWYLHPDLPGAAIRSTIVYRYEIPAGGATGKQRVQGNIVSLVISGHGRTVVNGVEHKWSAGDVIGLPPQRDGVVFQHFNESDIEAQIITAEPNLLDAFSVDMGSGFEQIEDVPDIPAPSEAST